jgi:hypothetical protein
MTAVQITGEDGFVVLVVSFSVRRDRFGTADGLSGSVWHPYARALLAAAPRLHQRGVVRC